MEYTANHLAGRKVRIQLRDPFNPKARGCMFVGRDLTPVIRIKPSLWIDDREAFWAVYLHECGHLREHSHKIKPSDGNVTKPVRANTLKGKVLEIGDNIDELAADLWAVHWRRFAGDGPIMGRLLQLMKWQE